MSISSLIESTETRRRWWAFLITAAAVFVLLCLIWPLSIRGFRSTAALAIDQSVEKTDDELRNELNEAILAETSDAQLQSVVDAIERSGKLRSERIEYRDFQTIRESIRVGLFKDQSVRRYQIAYEGDGGSDERQLVDMLTFRVANRLNLGNGTGGNVEESVEQLDWIVQQMNGDISFVKQALSQLDSPVESLGHDDQLTLEESSNLDSSGGSFHLASTKRNKAVTIDDIENSIDSIDIQNLRNVVSGLKSNLSGGSGSLGPMGAGNSELQKMKRSKTLPINGVPSIPFLLLLGGFSAMIGSVVAWNCDPFSKKGFTDQQNVKHRLKVPVIGSLNLTSPHQISQVTEGDQPVLEQKTNRECFANRIVRIAVIFLICVLAIVFTFILFNSEIRAAFFENPFLGAAKIVRAFIGY